MKIQVILLLGVCAAVTLGTEKGGGYGGYGGGGKGKTKGDDYSHIDFGPPTWVHVPVTQYREVEVQRPVTVYQPTYVKEPYTTYKKVLQPPPPKLIKKPVVTHTQEWKLVPVPKITYEQIWVHPYYEEEKKEEKGCWFCGKGKAEKEKGTEVVIVDQPGYAPPQPAPYHPPAPVHHAPAPIVHHGPAPIVHHGPPPPVHHAPAPIVHHGPPPKGKGH